MRQSNKPAVIIPKNYSYENRDSTYFKAMEVSIDIFADNEQVFDFYGAHSNCFKINNMYITVLEDPQDGYRSNYGACMFVENPGGFFNTPLAQVRISSMKNANRWVYEFVDVEDGHIWLTFGTENTDDYYPYFLYAYIPKLR
ncbi:MAG: hypothetical protein WC761_02085 [Candidatus Paceibacterota bacterium]|jgi:hypothetical protein